MFNIQIKKQPPIDETPRRIDKHLMAGVDYLTPAQIAAIYQTKLTAGVDYLTPAQIAALIAAAIAGISFPSQVKVKAESRDMTLATGAVSYTGYGFKPTGLIIFGYYASSRTCEGASDPAKGMWLTLMANGSMSSMSDRLIHLWSSSSVQQVATLTSYDNDGFTLQWSKTGLPTGTGYFKVFAFK